MNRLTAYIGECVRVEETDNADLLDALVVTINPPDEPDDWATLTFEISRVEARELIAGLAALL